MQNGVTISTRESDLEVKYGMVKFREERESARTSFKYILSDMNNIRRRYIVLGFHLDEFRKCGYYYDFGYPTMEEFCAANLGMDKTAVSRCINVYREFNASKSVKYEDGLKTVGSAMDLDDRYKEFSYSQLCEMLSMNEEERNQVTPDMTIKQIREVKKGNVSQNVSQVATSQPEKFDNTNYSVKKGIVQQNYVKNCKSLENVQLRIFDKNGKFLKYGHIVDVIYKCPGSIYLRLRDDYSDISDLFY